MKHVTLQKIVAPDFRYDPRICIFGFIFLSIPIPSHPLLLLNILLNFVLFSLYNLLPPLYDNSSLISSHFFYRKFYSLLCCLWAAWAAVIAGTWKRDFPLSISVLLRLNFHTSSGNQVSCCRYAREWCYLVAAWDPRHYSYWVASNGRLTLDGAWRRTGFARVLCWLFNEVYRLNYLCTAMR